MSKTKYYAVFNPYSPQGTTHDEGQGALNSFSDASFIFNNWTDCQRFIAKFTAKGKQVHFKSFASKAEAELYLASLKEKYLVNSKNREDSQGEIYTDGSYSDAFPYSSWAWVFVKNDTLLEQASGLCKNKSTTRQIVGELEAVLQAGAWCFENKKKVVLHYDYEGIRSWALGVWSQKNEVSQRYSQQIKKFLPYFSFQKVKAHSNNKWNEVVDGLAKKAIEKEIAPKKQ